MNQQLLILALVLSAFSSCANLRSKPESTPDSDLARMDSPLSPIEPNSALSQPQPPPGNHLPPAVTSQPSSQKFQASSPEPMTPISPTNTAPRSEEMKIVLKNKDGKHVEGSAPSQILPPANDPIKPLAPTPTQTEFSVGGAPILSDQDFEVVESQQMVRVPGPVPADKALLWMKNGNRRFVRGVMRKDGATKKDIQKVASSNQQPHTAIFSCSDSRLPPEVVFDQKLGEVYVVRNRAMTLDDQAITSLEYATENLGTNLIVVFGAKECLPLGDASNSRTPSAAGSANAPPLATAPNSKRPRGAKSASKTRTKSPAKAQDSMSSKPEPEANPETLAALQEIHQILLEQSRKIRMAVEAGTLKIQLGVYDLKQGSVTFKEN